MTRPQFHNPLCAVDTAIFTLLDNRLHVLLVKRDRPPAAERWALPGGVIRPAIDETIEATALRKLKARTGIVPPYLEQVGTVGNSSRDPRDWSITIVHFALVNHAAVEPIIGDGVSDVRWIPLDEVGVTVSLALDHEKLLGMAIERLRSKVRYTMLPAFMLPTEFTLKELVDAYQAVLGNVEQAMVRKRALREGLVLETGGQRTGKNRPAKLYRVAPGAQDHFFERVIGA